MPYELFLALRYLRSRRKRKLARATAIAAVLGIALGVAALIIAFGLSNGFRDEMREKILQGTSHISIVPTQLAQFSPDSVTKLQIDQVPGVSRVATTTYDGALVRGPRASAYAVLRGVEKEHPETIPQHWLQSGSVGAMFDQTSTGLIGNELASRLGVAVGETVQLVPANDFGVSASPEIKKIRIAGIFRSGLFEYDSTWIYVSMTTADNLSSNNHAGTVISVQVKDVENVGPTSEEIRKRIGNSFTVIDWQQANQQLFSALALERRMGLFIIGLIIAMASLNITSMLILVVVERRRDIAILNALGAGRRGVLLLFVIEGAIVGFIGAAGGVILGLACCAIANYFKVVSLPPDVYSISNVPLNIHLSEALLSALVAFLLSVVATIYPARAASQTRPIEILRDAV